MQDLIFSRQQYEALISRLDEIRNRLALLKPTEPTSQGFMEAHDIMRQYHISKRTLERWRHTGRVPCHKVGNFIYYNTADIVGVISSKDEPPT